MKPRQRAIIFTAMSIALGLPPCIASANAASNASPNPDMQAIVSSATSSSTRSSERPKWTKGSIKTMCYDTMGNMPRHYQYCLSSNANKVGHEMTDDDIAVLKKGATPPRNGNYKTPPPIKVPGGTDSSVN